MDKNQTALSVENLHKSFGEIEVLKGMSKPKDIKQVERIRTKLASVITIIDITGAARIIIPGSTALMRHFLRQRSFFICPFSLSLSGW